MRVRVCTDPALHDRQLPVTSASSRAAQAVDACESRSTLPIRARADRRLIVRALACISALRVNCEWCQAAIKPKLTCCAGVGTAKIAGCADETAAALTVSARSGRWHAVRTVCNKRNASDVAG